MRYIHLLLIVFSTTLLFSCKTIGQINAPVEKIDGKEYYMHTVQKKQTMFAISGLYKIEMNELLSANPGSDAGIKEGQVIKVPVAKTAFAKTNEASLLLHEVQKKETLFSIAQKYNIEVNDLIAANPGADAGLKKGQFLRIPQAKKVDVPAESGDFIEHTVLAGETLYSLSVRYKVKVEEIKKINNLTSDALKEGMKLRIPGIVSVDGADEEKIVEPVVVLGGPKEQYKIALMLPFYTQFGDSASMDSRDLLQREASLDIYRGVLIAVDSLEAMGLKADLYIYDVLDGRTAIEQILKKPEMSGMDLIIGPTFRDPIKAVVDFSTRYGIPVVCPTPQSNRILLSAPNLCKASPSSVTLMEELGEFVAREHKNDNVILLNNKPKDQNLDDLKMTQTFKDKYLATKGDTIINEVVTTARSGSGLSSKLVSGKTNVIVIPSNDRLLITSVINTLGSRTDVIVYGTEDWKNMDILGAEERERLRIRFAVPSWIDYYDPQSVDFVEGFRSRFKKEPQSFAFTGYDIMIYYGQGLGLYGRGLSAHFNEIPQTHLLSLGFDYVKTGPENGSENSHIFVIGHEEGKLVVEKK